MKHRSTFVAMLVAGLVVLGACGSDGSGSRDTTKPDNGTDQATAAPSTSTADGGEASGESITIGVANLSAGPNSFPSYVEGVDAAVAYNNAELDGVDGRQLAVQHCTVDQTPESAQNCGQQFANDSDVRVAATGVIYTAAPFYDALGAAGKPIIEGIATTDADYNTGYARFFYGGGAVSIPAVPTLAVRSVRDAKKALYVASKSFMIKDYELVPQADVIVTER